MGRPDADQPGALRIESATREDAERIASFQERMSLETEDRVLDAATIRRGVAHVFDNPTTGFYLVARDGTEVVASLLVTTEWSDWRAGTFWWIQSVYVAASHRRRGIYRALFDDVRARAARTPGVCGFRLYVEQENEIAQQTYRALGMVETAYRLFEMPHEGPSPG